MNQNTNKKPTNAQLIKKIQKAVVFVERVKDTKEIFFSDRGLRLTITDDTAVVSLGGSQIHCFPKVLSTGYSRPYLYLQTFVDIALEKADDGTIMTENGMSYNKLREALNKTDGDQQFIFNYVDMWLFNITTPVFSIAEGAPNVHLVTEAYWFNIARTELFLSEKIEDLTNKQFTEKVIDKVKEFMKGAPEIVIFNKKTDEELIQEEISAMEATEAERVIDEQAKEQNNE